MTGEESRMYAITHSDASQIIPGLDVDLFLMSTSKSILGVCYVCDTKRSATDQKITKLEKHITSTDSFLTLDSRHHSGKLKIKIVLISTAIAIILVSSLLVSSYKGENVKHEISYISSGVIVQDSQGGTIETWKPWMLPADRALTISILDSSLVSQDKIDAIKDAILSEATLQVDSSLVYTGQADSTSTYYEGWKGALESVTSSDSKFHIPTKFVFVSSPSDAADVTIELTDMASPDEYAGYTKSTLGEDHILKTHMIIYGVDKHSADRLGSVVRHEFGHALGIGHSTDSEDLMHYVISTDYPYISGCDISAIQSLYDGKESSFVVCEK